MKEKKKRRIKRSSAKDKGRRFQKHVRKKLMECFPELAEGDVKVAVGSEGGRDVKLSPVGETIIPFDIECKNVEQLALWDAISQAERNSPRLDRVPLVVFKRNRSRTYAIIEFEELLQLLSRVK